MATVVNAAQEQAGYFFSGSRSVSLIQLPPLSLYVHIPWCVRKCPYCDFNSHAQQGSLSEQDYIRALLMDLEQELPLVWGRSIGSIFIGGGTPGLFSAAAIDELLSGIRARLRVLPEAEITLETNPGTFEQVRFQGFRQAGINRLSIGVQSFNDAALAALGRIHNHREALVAIEAALMLFDKVNIDLMYALPAQNVQAALNDIQTAMNTGVRHISAYQLTLEPNTAFGHTPPPGLPEEDALADIEEAVHGRLSSAGFYRYETSAFARDAAQPCRHNLNYWQFGDYLGIGAGAHGKISSANGILRTVKSRHPKDYLAAMLSSCPQDAVVRKEIHPHDLPFEFMMNALRLTEGVDTALFTERTGLSVANISRNIDTAVKRGLLDSNPARLYPTALGQRFLNDLLAIFLAEGKN
ncbi:radical SAM family heme chaperone HemW [Stenoxybacter acetivorans]|uniref:radical SAM family heme chaperone HemW n=1 Tax=Stenoxybacter acetivorans TaxID=422441 RepID=UPI000A07BBD0|nr:radical SAM family heme chaperone HemW [Stenoxybacter acetivorans]